MPPSSIRCILILIMLITCGCAPVALGTGSAVADIVLGELIREGVAYVAPDAVAMVVGGVDRLGRFGGNPRWSALVHGRAPRVQKINGMVFVGEGW